jgi:hypothetical protein
VKNIDALPAAVAALAQAGDLVITLGAGSIGTVADRILDQLRGTTAAGRARLSTKAEGKSGPTDLSAEADAETDSGGEGG